VAFNNRFVTFVTLYGTLRVKGITKLITRPDYFDVRNLKKWDLRLDYYISHFPVFSG
jgi:hypothetical protein